LRLAQQAAGLNLGIAYNRHAYFAGAVHKRNEIVLFADVGDGLVEVDIPCKVGRVDRRPCFTSPLHRRFAWQWWFLGLGRDPSFVYKFLSHLCQGDPDVWNAVEPGEVFDRRHSVREVAIEMYSYHYAKPGKGVWWTRERLPMRQSRLCHERR